MLWRACFCVILLLRPMAALAGAWPQGTGNVFLSFSYEVTASREEWIDIFRGSEGEGDSGSAGSSEPLTREEAEALRDQGLVDALDPNAFDRPDGAPLVPREVDVTALLAGPTPSDGAGDPEAFHYGSAYGEIGISERVTLGFDLGSDEDPNSYQAIFFAVFALTPADWRLRAALELGAGQRRFLADPDDFAPLKDLRDQGSEMVLRPGLSLGYGFESPWGPGWAALDLRQEYRMKRDETVTKIDLTLGLDRGERALIYLQAQYSDYPLTAPNLRLVPTYVRKINDRLSLEGALLYDAWGSGDRVGLKAGIWLRF